VENVAATGALGVAFGGATAVIKGALTTRSKTSEELRDQRLDVYRAIWVKTAAISRYPPAEITWYDLEALHLAFRSWYFTTGGIFLSERARDRYFDVQKLLNVYLESRRGGGPSALVEPGDYDAIANTCSAFRTAMTEDLATRRQKSIVFTVKSRRWHRKEGRAARRRIAGYGAKPLRCPLDEMPLVVDAAFEERENGALRVGGDHEPARRDRHGTEEHTAT
jgi:hypothetical protein